MTEEPIKIMPNECKIGMTNLANNPLYVWGPIRTTIMVKAGNSEMVYTKEEKP